MSTVRTTSLLVFACRSAACRPPTSGGTGGSSPMAAAGAGTASSARDALKKSRTAVETVLSKLGDRNDLTSDESMTLRAAEALHGYTTTDYAPVNRMLRRGDETPQSRMLDIAFDRFSVRLTKPITVERGMTGVPLEQSGFRVGAVVSDKAFMSTSSEGWVADMFTNNTTVRQPDRYVMRIKVPAGQRVLAGEPGEKELILDRNTSLRITSIVSSNPRSARGETVHEIETEVVPS